MDLAFKHAEQRKGFHGYTASVGAAQSRSRVTVDSDRRWNAAVDREFDLAPAYVMGLDVAAAYRCDRAGA